jgi:hypothetical protein
VESRMPNDPLHKTGHATDDSGGVDFLPPEVARLLGALDGVAERLADICERLAAGVDPQGGPTVPGGTVVTGSLLVSEAPTAVAGQDVRRGERLNRVLQYSNLCPWVGP